MLNQNVLLSAEMLNMLNMLNVLNLLGELEGDPWGEEFQIVSISAERSTFSEKCGSFSCNVEYVAFFGGLLNKNCVALQKR